MRCLPLMLLLCSCNLDPPSTHEGPTSFNVRFADGQDLGETTPLPFMETGGVNLDLLVSPIGAPFAGWVSISAEPGVVTDVVGHSGTHVYLDLAEGEEMALTVTLTLAFSVTRVWVDDDGYQPASGTPACSDGEDNDGDGMRDHGQDPGCVDATDGSEEGGSYILGVSGPVRFENPRVADVQGSGFDPPLLGRSVVIDRGRLVVTRISTEGFYVTDIDPTAPADGSNSLFVYNYQTPWHLRECDLVTNLAGIVGEFYGYTELQFPSWDVIDPGSRVPEPSSSAECPIPDPVVLTAGIAGDDWEMEPIEAGLVRILDGRIGDTFRDCDFDGNGSVDFEGPEGDCRDGCELDAECTELTQYFRYGQYSVVLDGCTGADCTAVFVVSRDAAPWYWADRHAGETIPVITGTVRHLYFAVPEWIVEPRCSDDLVTSGTALPMYRACVPPYARGEYYDDN